MENGACQNTTQTSYECDICKDAEFIIEERDTTIILADGTTNPIKQDVAVPCSCRDKKQIKRLMKSSRITDAFREMTFSNFDTANRPAVIQQMYAVAYKYTKELPNLIKNKARYNSCCLLGQPGVGKSHLLTAVSNNLLAKGIAVQYFPWVEGINDLQSDFEAAKQKVSYMQQVSVLFIDDLFKGRDKPTPWQLEQIFGIINYRYLNNLPILISSEKTIAQMCEFDEATGSRIIEMCKNYKVTIERDLNLNYRLLGTE
ncbi:DnaA ATPase domain-containing protein [Paenibacillus shenyangensis]|uniref:DnaA ATPase domain-containing protein n=1 Tax=Paenibacillus sp. A9 TaxID=1284352 RepID=UPI000361BEA3|nr:DnaA/Hda family protein [Paenibacillus sp. A9]